MGSETYNALVYAKQGSTEFVVASSGLITVESGGAVNIQSGASIVVSDGGKITNPVVSDTSGTALSNYGMSALVNGSSAPTTFTMDAPAAGVTKIISGDGTFGTSAIGYIDVGAGVTVGSTQRYISITGAYPVIHLSGINTTSWALVAATNSTVSTGAT